MIKWTFYYEQGSVVADAKDEIEYMHYSDAVYDGEGFLHIEGKDIDLHVNMAFVKLATRQIVPDAPLIEAGEPIAIAPDAVDPGPNRLDGQPIEPIADNPVAG